MRTTRIDDDLTAQDGAASVTNLPATIDIVCLSHLRWDFVFQRPQHLLSRFARERRVVVVEEAHFDSDRPRVDLRRESNLTIAVPHLPAGLATETIDSLLRSQLTRLLAQEEITDFALWYYTPMMLSFSDHLKPRLIIYDCMDELSAFAGAPPEMISREADLMRRADVVFTGGQSLFEAKQHRHDNVHCFPSSIERDHFASARDGLPDPADMASIPRPRIGFYGVIDERLDIGLLRDVAALMPDHHFVIIGPVVKIDESSLPQASNLHYLGRKDYRDLPTYLANWDIAMLPFARNDSTRFISPTKTPEYLAAARPVVSTPITDVVRPYGELGLVHIADHAEGWRNAILAALDQRTDRTWLDRVDSHLGRGSWDSTWRGMGQCMAEAIRSRGVATGI